MGQRFGPEPTTPPVVIFQQRAPAVSQDVSSSQASQPKPQEVRQPPPPPKPACSDNLTANHWEEKTFDDDMDGAKRNKFLRLMGLKSKVAIFRILLAQYSQEAPPPPPSAPAKTETKFVQRPYTLACFEYDISLGCLTLAL